jgi:hypothetical protein
MIRDWNAKATDFYNAVWYLTQVQTYHGDPKPSFGVAIAEQWEKVVNLRQDLRNRAEEIGVQVQAELEE